MSVSFWAAVLLLGAFGIAFTFANYTSFGIGVVLVMLLAIANSERKRKARRRASESARQDRAARRRDLSGE
jgi:hypothetical protein